MHLTKRNKEINKLVDKSKVYTIAEAVANLKKGPKTKFDQTVEISMKVDLEQSTTPVRGMVTLPHGIGKKTRIAVFCKGDYEQQAKDAGADFVGGDSLVHKVAEGWVDFDVAVATPDMMRDLAKLGKVLGPRGLMPNPKTGTVTTDIARTVKELAGGKMEFRMDKQSGINGSVGKLSFEDAALVENIQSYVKAVMNANPKLQRAGGVKSIAISSTMGPGFKLDVEQFRQA